MMALIASRRYPFLAATIDGHLRAPYLVISLDKGKRYVDCGRCKRRRIERFAELLGKAAAGETVIITKRGAPVAQLMPYRTEAASPERKAAWDELILSLKRGVPIGASAAEARAWKWNRDELYERD